MKKQRRLEPIPKGSIPLYTDGEGDFTATLWKHLKATIGGVSGAGHLDAAALEDEGDKMSPWARVLQNALALQVNRFVWDLRAVKTIDREGLELLQRTHRRISARAACALVLNGCASSASLVTELEGCYIAETVSEAITWLRDKDADG